jgi:hypothetical protein
MVERQIWLRRVLSFSHQDPNQRNVQAFTKKERIKMRNVVIKNITDKADEAARQWNKTKDPTYKEEWYKLIKEATQHFPKEQSGNRINFKRKT